MSILLLFGSGTPATPVGFKTPLPLGVLGLLGTQSTGFPAYWAINSNQYLEDVFMQKNVAGQKIGVQMVSATDGSAFTGAVTVYVTGDAGTQAIGSVGGGACTHEGNGYHTYAPAQAETNYDLIAFTFIGTGAIPSTVQLSTAMDANMVRVAGTTQTAGDLAAMLTTIDDFLDTEIAAILADTNELQTDWADGGRLDLILDSRASQTSVDTIDDLLDTEMPALTSELAKVPKSDGVVTWNATAAAQIQSEAADALNAYDPPTSAELVSEINAVQADIAALSIPSAATIADAVWDEDATAHQTQGTFGQAIGDPGIDTDTIWGLVNTNLNATISSRASQTSVDTIDDFLDTEIAAILAAVDTEVAAILADTNELQTDWANGGRLDLILDARASQASVDALPTAAEVTDAVWDEAQAGHVTVGTFGYYLDAQVSASGSLTVQDIVDGVWDEPIASHVIAGSTADALADAGAAGDPWNTALPGAYGAGTAGKIIGDNINATISSRATQTSVDTIDDFLDTEIAAILAAVDTEVSAILADTNELQTDWADGGRLDLILDSRASQTSVNTIDDFLDTEIAAILAAVDTEVAAILADTNELQTDWADGGRLDLILDSRASQTSVDDLPTNAELTAEIGTLPTALENADALLKYDWTGLTGEADRSVLNALRFIRNKFSTTANPGFVTVYKEDDATQAFTKPLTTDAAAEPIVEG